MAWVRIHDGALSHPKLVGLIDWRNPFCLWVWGLSYCQTHLTDGWIPAAALPNPTALKTAAKLVAARAWEAQSDGYQVHDYLDWNDSRLVVHRKRTESKERMANARARSSRDVRANFYVDSGVRSGSSSSEREPERKPLASLAAVPDPSIASRAAALLEQYAALYTTHRNGARLRLTRTSIEFTTACTLCETWSDERLIKLAEIFLTTDDPWISGTERHFMLFAQKATWCDDRLSAWEAERRKAAR